ncbi:hypothetical protein PENSPDRAFT_111285 [Peniophora sp. CONT]|nr:hypothetical protein PENSPDRAFT_111285 [Peniophora sp. CONT]
MSFLLQCLPLRGSRSRSNAIESQTPDLYKLLDNENNTLTGTDVDGLSRDDVGDDLVTVGPSNSANDPPIAIGRLSNELLCSILTECADDASPSRALSRDQSIVPVVCLVCKRWYEAAVTVPALWTTLTSRLSAAGVEHWLERSQNLSLRVIFDVPKNPALTLRIAERVLVPSMPRMQALYVRGKLASVVKALAVREQKAPRFELLAIAPSNPHDRYSRDVDDATFAAPFMRMPFNELRLSSQLLPSLSALRDVDVRNLEVGPCEGGLSDELLLTSWFEPLFQGFQAWRGLKTLRLDMRGLPEGESDRRIRGEPAVLPALKELYLAGCTDFCRAILRLISCPSLRKLGISTSWKYARSHGQNETAVGFKKFNAWRFQMLSVRSLLLWVDVAHERVVFFGLHELIGWDDPHRASQTLAQAHMKAIYTLEMSRPDSGLRQIFHTAREILQSLSSEAEGFAPEELCILSMDYGEWYPVLLQLSSALRELKCIRVLAVHCHASFFDSFAKLWESNDVNTSPIRLRTLTLMGPAVAVREEGLTEKIYKARGGKGRAPIFICVEDALTNKIMRIMEEMDLLPALWGRQRNQ